MVGFAPNAPAPFLISTCAAAPMTVQQTTRRKERRCCACSGVLTDTPRYPLSALIPRIFIESLNLDLRAVACRANRHHHCSFALVNHASNGTAAVRVFLCSFESKDAFFERGLVEGEHLVGLFLALEIQCAFSAGVPW